MTDTQATTQGLSNIREELHPLIKDAIKLGYKVFAPTEGLRDKVEYVYFTDGTRIGYCEYNQLEGFCFSTVHKPSRQNGTGGSVVRGLDYYEGIADYIPQSMAYVPSWWNCGQVEKYRDFEQFNKNRHSQKPLIEIVE